MNTLALQPHVGFGMIASRPVFLDLARDRYIALDARAEGYFLALLRGEPISSQGCGRLLATGLFGRADAPSPIAAAMIPMAQASLLDQPRARPSLSLALGAYARIARVRRQLLREPLLTVLGIEGRRPQTSHPAGSDAMMAQARRFLAARSLVPIPPKCLPDSLVLRQWLGRSGVRPALVFAARLDPFGAHCWLQCESLVLNDAPDTVAAFTPVLVLR